MKHCWPIMIALAVLITLVMAIAWTPPVGQAAPAAQTDAETLFQQRCVPCHGPKAAGTKTAPALTHLQADTDEELYQIIAEGRPGTAMPAWKTMLSVDEMRALVPYLRTLANAASQPPAPTSVPLPNPAVQPAFVVTLDATPSTAGVVIVRATVRDARGQPVYNVPVSFNLVTALGGTLEVGSTKTDSLGSALIEYTAGEGRRITLQATAGQGAQAATASASATTSGSVEWTPAPLISPDPPVVEIAVLVLVLGGVWLTYMFIASQLLGILRQG